MDSDDPLRLENQLCFPLYAVSNIITRKYKPLLDSLDLTYTQYIVMLVLWEKDGVSVSEIGEKLMLDNGTLSPLLKKLENAGYIERSRCREDDRVVEISLTKEGRALKEKARKIPYQIAGCFDIPEEKAAQLYELLYELLESRGYKKSELN